MNIIRIICIFALGFCAWYLVSPISSFPPPPPDTLESKEFADTESIYRRAYYSNYTREEIIAYYQKTFIPLPALRQNYPPEDAQTLVRDQTQSSWLEELVHPGRDSIYINGFYPTKPTEQINIEGRHFLNKITVRLLPSQPATRLTSLLLAAIALYWLIKEYSHV